MNIRMKKSNVINTLFYDFFLQNDDVANFYWSHMGLLLTLPCYLPIIIYHIISLLKKL